MLLILTNSMDGTTDLLLPFLNRKGKVFRYNIDLWRDYKLRVTSETFVIQDPTGREITQESCTGLYLRKTYFLDEDRPRPIGGDIISWSQSQISAIVDGICNICDQKKLTRLVERGSDRRVSKILQMRLAAKYFKVPHWSISTNHTEDTHASRVVCKSLRSSFVSDYKSLFVQEVSLDEIDFAYPWFLQDLVESAYDLTVVFVEGKCFPFRKARSKESPVDYRESLASQNEGWEHTCLPDDLRSLISAYMVDLGLRFGRLDFVGANDILHFLEVNPNGQYAWLDPFDHHGMLSHIANKVGSGFGYSH